MCYTKTNQRGESMYSLLNAVDSAIKSFLGQLAESLGFIGVLAIVLGVELFFIILFAIKSAFSYEARLSRTLDKANAWLFNNKTLNENNVRAFTNIIKSGPKRMTYYWQQFILYREGGPTAYMTEENLIEKPLKSSSWKNNVKNLTILTTVWSIVGLILGLATQVTQTFSVQVVALSLVLPLGVWFLGTVAILFIRGKRAVNLDEIYHLYHLFARFITNASADLPPFIDFNLLFTPKEIEKGNAQLREYYESYTRKAKEDFEKVKESEMEYVKYDFENIGIDGSALLSRAMKESEKFVNLKAKAQSQMAIVDTRRDALRRNHEDVQISQQRKIQATKENIAKYIELQAQTTNRIDVQKLKKQQSDEIARQEEYQARYDEEERKFTEEMANLDAEMEALKADLEANLKATKDGMKAEYESFFEKVMKSAYKLVGQTAEAEKREYLVEREKSEDALAVVQTQIKHLMDENSTLRTRLSEYDTYYQDNTISDLGRYVNGVFVSRDGAYHDEKGFYHDNNGKIYDLNGNLVSEDESDEDRNKRALEKIEQEQISQFGEFIPLKEEKKETNQEEILPKPLIFNVQEVKEPEEENLPAQAVVEEYNPNEDIAPQEETSFQVKEEPQKAPKEIVKVEETTQPATPAKKRGRPRKAATEEKKIETAPAKKRGRPRKVASKAEPVKTPEKKTEAKTQPAKKRGRPRKVASEETKVETTPAKKRGRPRKEEGKATVKPATVKQQPKKPVARKKTVKSSVAEQPATPAKKRGRPRKQTINVDDLDSLEKISQLISEEEKKLSNMKAAINSQIDEALNKATQLDIDKEKDEIMKQIDILQKQAGEAKEENSAVSARSINRRIEELIRQISEIDNKSNRG